MPDETQEVTLRVAGVELQGTLTLPRSPIGVVLFAHGSGSSRFSTRNRHVSGELVKAGLGTLLMDLLTAQEERRDLVTAELRFDIGLLAGRFTDAVRWAAKRTGLPIGCFGASTGAAAALIAAADEPALVGAVVSRGGRPDLAGEALRRVRAPTLLIVGGDDIPVIGLNRSAQEQLTCEKHMAIVPGASHLFEEPGTLEEVARLASRWFSEKLSLAGHRSAA